MSSYECILTETRGSGERRVGLVTLNRPKQLNALNDTLMDELGAALRAFDADEAIGCIVLTGGEKAFAAGADIAMMAPFGFVDAYTKGLISRNWETIREIRKPVIGAVAGFALGGGCELAMMCDFIIAADSAKFGQPEIKLGLIPGYGGTQRLPRLVGPSAALKLILTGEIIPAAEALRIGLVDEVVPAADLLTRARALALHIAAQAPLAVAASIEAVHRGASLPLDQALALEARIFGRLSNSADKHEGVKAFLEKRAPTFTGK